MELNAKDQKEFDQKLTQLLLTISAQKNKLGEIRDIDSYFSFIQDFQKKAGTDRPIDIHVDKPVDPEHVDKLKRLNYPEEYIQWAEKYGQYTIWIEAAVISSLDTVMNEVNGYYSLPAHNNYLFFAGDGGGNMFAFDRNKPGDRIRYFDHNSYVCEDNIEEIYSEIYDYYENEDGELINSNHLNEKKIFDKNGNYLQNSIYIRQHLKDREVSELQKPKGFLPFLLATTAEGFANIVDRYSNDVFRVSSALLSAGKVEEAIASYTVLVEAKSRSAMVFNNRACLYRMAGQLENAVNDAKKAISLEKDGLFYGTLAEIYADMNDDKGFFKYLRLAIVNRMSVTELESDVLEKYKRDPRFLALHKRHHVK